MPDQFGFDRLEERFNSGIVIAMSFFTLRNCEPMPTQDLLIVTPRALSAAIRVMDVALRR